MSTQSLRTSGGSLRRGKLAVFLMLAALVPLCGQGCPPAEPGPPGPTGPQGPQGPEGPAGPSGSLRIYGDGSAGAGTIAADTDWLTSPPVQNNTQFTSFVVNAGVTLTVPSGTIIRCTGEFTNNGTIEVLSGTPGAHADNSAGEFGVLIDQNYMPPGVGIALSMPSFGEYANNSGLALLGGFGGTGVTSTFAATQLRYPGLAGGGGGAACVAGGAESFGGSGGGTLTVLAQGAIINQGNILANAIDTTTPISAGSGGGGGGVVVLASATSINNTAGLITANGGAGGDNDVSRGPGGGGGGGIVNLFAPTVLPGPVANILVLGGAPGANTVTVTTASRQAGSGGGASGGNGGGGGNVPAEDATPGPAAPGAAGIITVSQVDPTSLF